LAKKMVEKKGNPTVTQQILGKKKKGWITLAYTFWEEGGRIRICRGRKPRNFTVDLETNTTGKKEKPKTRLTSKG